MLLSKSAEVAGLLTNSKEKLHTSSCHFTMLLNPSGANTLALFTPHHNLVWDLRQPSTGKRLGIASQRQPEGLQCSWGGQ